MIISNILLIIAILVLLLRILLPDCHNIALNIDCA